MGFIDGAAPPFIMLALASAMMGALLTFAAYAAERPQLRERAERWVIGYFGSSAVLVLCLLIRIIAKGSLKGDEGELFFGVFDGLILLLTSFVLSSFGALSYLTWRYLREFPPQRN